MSTFCYVKKCSKLCTGNISVKSIQFFKMFYFHFFVKTSHLWEVQTGVLEHTFLAQTYHQSSGRMGGGAKSYPRATMMT